MDPGLTTLPPQPRTLAARLRPLVAVLPFTASGGGASLAQLASELTERLSDTLASDPAMQAILVDCDLIANAPPHALDLACRESRVGHLISGKCHPNGGQPSLYIELTDTRDWHIRWADFYTGGARTLLADDGDAMRALVQQLRTELRLYARR